MPGGGVGTGAFRRIFDAFGGGIWMNAVIVCVPRMDKDSVKQHLKKGFLEVFMKG